MPGPRDPVTGTTPADVASMLKAPTVTNVPRRKYIGNLAPTQRRGSAFQLARALPLESGRLHRAVNHATAGAKRAAALTQRLLAWHCSRFQQPSASDHGQP